MSCACGEFHTITLSDDGTAHSFGKNFEGALGLGNRKNFLVPTPISKLPKISMVSCGRNFTVCVDCKGFVWSFGKNNFGQLGTGNKKDSKFLKNLKTFPLCFLFLVDMSTH